MLSVPPTDASCAESPSVYIHTASSDVNTEAAPCWSDAAVIDLLEQGRAVKRAEMSCMFHICRHICYVYSDI